jgi:hypothetical protein
MVDLLPPPRPRLYRLAVFLTEDQFTKLKALSRERRQKPGRVASLIVEAVLKERDVGGGLPEEVAAGGA